MNHLMRLAFAAIALSPLTACDDVIEDPVETWDEDPTEPRFSPRGRFPKKRAWQGRWEGEMTAVGSNPDYDATIVANAPFCAFGAGEYTAEWDYYSIGALCTSELALLGTGIGTDGKKIHTFYDTNVSGPCSDGLVDLKETDDPTVMMHTWRATSGVIDATGLVHINGVCSPGY